MTWNDVREAITSAKPKAGVGAHDFIRRGKVADAERASGIPMVVYAADFTDEGRAAQYGAGLQIELSDKTGFLQALSDIDDGPLDVLVHSPGGSPTATESIVRLLRSRFDPIRFIVPHTAKSAATMLVLSGDEILLGDAAELGPIDPQLRIVNDQRVITVPAGAAINQFRRIHREVTQNPDSIRGWLPILRQYGPSFLQECENAIRLSEELAAQWLQEYMFRGEGGAAETNPGGERGSAVSCKRRDVLRLSLENYQKWAEVAERGLMRAVPFLHSNRIFQAKDLPYATQLLPLGAIFAWLGSKAES